MPLANNAIIEMQINLLVLPCCHDFLESRLPDMAELAVRLHHSYSRPPSMEPLAEYFKVFSEPNRLAVLDALRDGPLNVTAVVERTGLSQALVSKHLKILMIAGVVSRQPEGSLVFYEVVDSQTFRLLAETERLMLASRRQQLDALAAIL